MPYAYAQDRAEFDNNQRGRIFEDRRNSPHLHDRVTLCIPCADSSETWHRSYYFSRPLMYGASSKPTTLISLAEILVVFVFPVARSDLLITLRFAHPRLSGSLCRSAAVRRRRRGLGRRTGELNHLLGHGTRRIVGAKPFELTLTLFSEPISFIFRHSCYSIECVFGNLIDHSIELFRPPELSKTDLSCEHVVNPSPHLGIFRHWRIFYAFERIPDTPGYPDITICDIEQERWFF